MPARRSTSSLKARRKLAITGGCHCGAVRYRASAKPLGSMVCHCRSCRRIAGAPMVAWLTFAAGDFKWIKGKPKAYQSSAPVRRGFCGRCGTQLTYQNPKASPGEIDVTTCTLDDADAFPPTHHSWLSHDLKWMQSGDELPAYPKSRYGGNQPG